MRTVALAALVLFAGQPASAQNQGGPRVQVAIVVDTSQSLRHFQRFVLAEVKQFLASQTANVPDGQLEVALVTYGLRANKATVTGLANSDDDTGEAKDLAFTTEVDTLYGLLATELERGLAGGQEGCGFALQTAYEMNEWSKNPNDRRAILIIGNEPFEQGNPSGRRAIEDHQREVDADERLEALALRRGEFYARLVVPIVVHSRYVGPRGEGTRAKDWQVRSLTDIQAGATAKVVHPKGVEDLPFQ